MNTKPQYDFEKEWKKLQAEMAAIRFMLINAQKEQVIRKDTN